MTNLSKQLFVPLIFALLLTVVEKSNAQLDYLMSIKKIDIHTHINNDAPFLRKFLDDYNMKVNTLSTGGLDTARMNFRINGATEFTNEQPRYYSWVTTFELVNRDDPNWTKNVIKKLKNDFEHGAVGVKIWKDIGMDIKNSDGEFIQVNDPMFKPIFEFIEEQGKTLIAHIGEPIQAWMPTYPISKDKPGIYWAKHPQFSFWDKADRPSYSDIMAARDNLIAKHPNLRVVGAHLASLEFDVNEIAKRLESYPNFAVEIGGRMRYLMWQAHGKVREFFIKYQDRIMYGTDLSGGDIKWKNNLERKATNEEIEKMNERLHYRHDLFFRYLATDDDIPCGNYIIGDMPLPEPTYTVKGLALPKKVLDKIFYENAVKWFPGVEKGFK
ncbi:MAG: amidohydrolase [Melioribacteraceae bacterium]|nr:amidohydrolase [Melioribacteraceae bacterium]